MTTQSIPCPECKTKIEFDPMGLLQGTAYSCSGCGAKIALSKEGEDPVKDAMEKFNELKNRGLQN